MRPWSTYVLVLIAIVLAVAVTHQYLGPNSMADTQSHSHKAALKNPDGSWRYTNALAKESSPYLLQHAHNPVNWYPWGPKAFDLARESGKPIFLSVGYSTCYWCHVMERQVFEDPEIAKLMNERFINVKVDREERPDVDDIYMMAVQMMTNHGGWPMSVFLTPPGADGPDDRGLRPFFAGTYFPPEQFVRLSEEIEKAWRDRRPEVSQRARQVADAVREHLSRRGDDGEDAAISADMVQQVARMLLQSYDHVHGGFGNAPKFPQPANLLFLLKVQRNNPNEELARALAHTLDRMARGGMCDQVGGGFHRYATDEKWLVPHFEKMLYDNGQLVEVYCIAHEMKPVEGDPGDHPRLIRAVCDYVLREMTDETGAFWSAQDAEVDAREGGNYVWTRDELKPVLGDDALTELAARMYGFDQGTNFRDPHAPDAEPVNVIYLPTKLHELAASMKTTLDELIERKRTIDERLLEVRDRRPQPATDDKVLTSWNGLMIAGMARAGRTLDEPRYTAAAVAAADCVLSRMRDGEGGLFRTMREGQVKIPAFLEDYAMFTHGLLELHRTDGDARWLDAARALTEIAIGRFETEGGGYFDTLEGQDDLFVRTRTTYDGAVCSGNSQMVHNLLDLYELTGEDAFLDRAIRDIRSFASEMKRLGVGMVHLHHALLRAMEMAPKRFGFGIDDAKDDAKAAPAATGAVAVKVDRADDQGDGGTRLRIAVRIDDGCHVNAHEPGIESVVPTTVSVSGAVDGWDLEVDYPRGAEKSAAGADTVRVYEGEVVLEATLRRRDGTDRGEPPALSLTYQVCRDDHCLLPETVELSVGAG